MPRNQPQETNAHFAWLPELDPESPKGAADALPPERESLAYHDEDPNGFCSYVEFLAEAMEAFKNGGDEEEDGTLSPLMIMVVESDDGDIYQVTEDIASRLTLWAGECLEDSNGSARAKGGIGLRLSQSLTGIAYAYPGDTEWEIAGTMVMDALPDVPGAE